MGKMTALLLQRFKPDYMLVAFDHGEKTLRHEELASYKANRKPTPSDLIQQLSLVQELLTNLGIKCLSMPGIEADDLIATAAIAAKELGHEVDIVSSDRDLLQLVQSQITVHLPQKGVSELLAVTETNFADAYLPILPSQVADLKGIMGDSSDNLEGVKGIGEKGAVRLLQKYGSLEAILASLDQLSLAEQMKFSAAVESALLCKRLGTLDKKVVMPLTPGELALGVCNESNLRAFLERYELRSLSASLLKP
ncbi:unnamed protein product [Didymodactylos carnosus]|uniref:5'-3' exonuclease domain-containing protein n=1 Tax=Didymodactylos carnosus TaxID=1234261 RepID=A0A8S2CQT7_9BILA|nr:unnamed protein product [Didymodactylos carnosus]CAF3491880.1 unnamed protein product [Didymodactylos carnosus]